MQRDVAEDPRRSAAAPADFMGDSDHVRQRAAVSAISLRLQHSKQARVAHLGDRFSVKDARLLGLDLAPAQGMDKRTRPVRQIAQRAGRVVHLRNPHNCLPVYYV